MAMRLAVAMLQQHQVDRTNPTPARSDHQYQTNAPSHQFGEIIVVDAAGDLYPPAVQSDELALPNLIVVRPRDNHITIQRPRPSRDGTNRNRITQTTSTGTHAPSSRWGRKEQAFWAVEQALRCPAVKVVVGFMPDWNARFSRRFQLAARQGKTIGILVREKPSTHRSFASLRLHVDARVDHWLDRIAMIGDKITGTHETVGRHEPSVRSQHVPDQRMHDPSGQHDASRSPPWRENVLRVTVLTAREGILALPFLLDVRDEEGLVSLPAVPVDRSVARTA